MKIIEIMEISTRTVNGVDCYTLKGMVTAVRVSAHERPNNITVLAVVAYAFGDGWFSYTPFNGTFHCVFNDNTYVVEILNGWPIAVAL